MRVAIWNTGSTLGAIIGQAIDLGAISIKDGIFGDSPWKYMYLIFGTLAAAYSIGLFFVLPDAPFSARFLKPRERQIAVQRLQSNNTGIHNKSFKLKQALAAWKDPQIWALACSFLGISFCNAGFAT